MPDMMEILEQFKAGDDLNVEELNRKYLVARKAITDVTGGSAMSGKITCPFCGKTGSLIFMACSNGHICRWFKYTEPACTNGRCYGLPDIVERQNYQLCCSLYAHKDQQNTEETKGGCNELGN